MTPEELAGMDASQLEELHRMVSRELDERQRSEQQRRIRDAALQRAVEQVLDIEARYARHGDPLELRAAVAQRPAPAPKADPAPPAGSRTPPPPKPSPIEVDGPEPIGPPPPPATGV